VNKREKKIHCYGTKVIQQAIASSKGVGVDRVHIMEGSI